ncbi:hypothetical protein [Peribacillus loiseleuriae]|uniref:non-homologous end-joining DNA ligase LigD n=1 Tax=Peribacillus loiseleuriae TaxID=1679170 RepID=UPI000A3F4AC2
MISVQHHEGKTIIAPYSTRGNDFAGVATPLYWEELRESEEAFKLEITPSLVCQSGL